MYKFIKIRDDMLKYNVIGIKFPLIYPLTFMQAQKFPIALIIDLFT